MGRPAYTEDPRAALRFERDRYVAFAFAAADLLIEIDAAGAVTFAAGAAQALTGMDARALVGTELLDLLAEGERPAAAALLRTIAPGGRLAPTPFRLAHGPEVGIGGCRLSADSEATHIAMMLPVAMSGAATAPGPRDASTGLLAEENFVKSAMKRVEQGAESPMAMTLISIDGLDGLRARVGAAAAQGMMGAMGKQIRAHSADGDSAGVLADGRYGVLHRPGALDAKQLTAQIAGLAAGLDPAGKGVDVIASSLDLARRELSETDAVRALVYALKEFSHSTHGTFRVASLADGLGGIVAGAVGKVAEIRSAVADGGIVLVFQPIVDLAQRKLHHFEALARFENGDSPASVLAFAEESGLAPEIDFEICKLAIAELGRRRDADDCPSIAVNLSGRSVESDIFVGRLLAALDAVPGLSHRLLFELTESALVTHMATVRGAIAALRERGFKVCLDDVGAGAASFQYLVDFPADFAKIDGKYVRAPDSDVRLRATLKAMVALCRELGLKTVAEMVETEAQVDALRALGVEYGQGYLFGKPAPEPKWGPKPAPSAPRRNLKRKGAVESWG